MECPVCITDLYKNYDKLPDDHSKLLVVLNETINSLEQWIQSSHLKSFSIDVNKDYPFTSDRNAVVENAKLITINETVDSLKLLYNNLERWNSTVIHDPCLYYGKNIDFKMKTKQHLNNLVENFDSLNKGAKSPYDLEAILDPDYLTQSLETHPTNNIHDRALLFIKIAQSELEIIKESTKTNEMQKVILTCYLDKLKTFNDQITSLSLVNLTSSSKKKSKSSKFNKINRICEIMKKCQRLIKDVYGLMKISIFKDHFNESDEIFNVINEKGSDAIDEIINFIESLKIDWIKKDTENVTRETVRAGALRRLNTILKLLKKFNLLKNDLESSFIVLGLKNITTDALFTHSSFRSVYHSASYLTFKNTHKPRVDVPLNFIRDDPIYEEIAGKPYNGFFIVFLHIIKYYEYMESLEWNPFQYRKPWSLTDYLLDMQVLIKKALNASFTHDEAYKISLDLADRYLMTKQKIKYDRETLQYRFDLFKPLKLYRFPDICKILHSQRPLFWKRWDLRGQLENKFDGLIGQLNRKVTNRGQLIVFERALAMMKRSIYLFKIIRSDTLPHYNRYLYYNLMEQAVNEYFYAYETVVKLLDSLRSNRRITFSFSAKGHFIEKVDSIGLKVKDEFLESVNSQVKNLEIQINNKKADLESVKDEKTQLKYLQSIANRIKLIPIKELEITDEDNIVIIREIIEEYEFTNIKYGRVNIAIDYSV